MKSTRIQIMGAIQTRIRQQDALLAPFSVRMNYHDSVFLSMTGENRSAESLTDQCSTSHWILVMDVSGNSSLKFLWGVFNTLIIMWITSHSVGGPSVREIQSFRDFYHRARRPFSGRSVTPRKTRRSTTVRVKKVWIQVDLCMWSRAIRSIRPKSRSDCSVLC